MKKFTKAELGKYNGKNGMPIFVAYQGKGMMYPVVFYGKKESTKFCTKPVQT